VAIIILEIFRREDKVIMRRADTSREKNGNKKSTVFLRVCEAPIPVAGREDEKLC